MTGVIDVEKLRALHEAATPGPYFCENDFGITGNFGKAVYEVARVNPHGEITPIAARQTMELLTFLRNSVPAILALAEREKRMREALERIAGASVAFNANPVGVIETMREWARDGLGEQP